MQNKKFPRKFIWLFPLAAAAFLTGGDCALFGDNDDKTFIGQATDKDGVQIAAIPLFSSPST